jgi:hypothetical protein
MPLREARRSRHCEAEGRDNLCVFILLRLPRRFAPRHERALGSCSRGQKPHFMAGFRTFCIKHLSRYNIKEKKICQNSR